MEGTSKQWERAFSLSEAVNTAAERFLPVAGLRCILALLAAIVTIIVIVHPSWVLNVSAPLT
jgi:hypothetical protein